MDYSTTQVVFLSIFFGAWVGLAGFSGFILADFAWENIKYRLDLRAKDKIRRENTIAHQRAREHLRNHALRKRASSSTCVEHLALNQKVPGSNPGGLTKRENSVRRRINWYLDTRTAIVFGENDVLPTKFQWRDLPRPRATEFGMTSPSDTGRGPIIRDFRPEEHKVQLLWDGMNTDTFLDEVQLKTFIIRMTYMIPNDELVPSELLADANLVYKDDWVDEWGCKDRNDDVIECPREIFRPCARNIRFNDRIVPRHPRGKHQNAKPRIHAKVHATSYSPPPEIPDEKCFFTFRAGGYYEKQQNPLENSCQKGEKAV